MKARTFSVIAALAALVLLSAGCKKYSWRPEPGTQIKFRAVSAPSKPEEATKTVYSGQYYTLYSTPFEHIDWVEGDDMTIGYVYYSDGEGEQLHGLSHGYIVSGVTSPNRSSDPSARSQASLTPAGGNGMVWQDADHHGFYACYPDLKTKNPDDFVFDIENGIVNYSLPLYFPAEQYPVSINGSATLTLLNGTTIPCVSYAPDMQYAYMCGDNMENGFVDAGGAVNLLFDSNEFTYYEFCVDSEDAETLVINYFSITDSQNSIAGDFELKMDPLAGRDYRNAVGNLSNTITFYFNEDKDPITLTKGTPILFGVFAGFYEGRNSSQMTITFNLDNGDVPMNRSLKLQKKVGDSYDWIDFPQQYKNRIYNLKVPQAIGPGALWFDSSNAGGYDNEDWNE